MGNSESNREGVQETPSEDIFPLEAGLGSSPNQRKKRRTPKPGLRPKMTVRAKRKRKQKQNSAEDRRMNPTLRRSTRQKSSSVEEPQPRPKAITKKASPPLASKPAKSIEPVRRTKKRKKVSQSNRNRSKTPPGSPRNDSLKEADRSFDAKRDSKGAKGNNPSSGVWLPRTHRDREYRVDLTSFAARRQAILKKLSPGASPSEMPGLKSQKEMLTNMLRTTVFSRQNNAALLMGPRGCGKSALLKQVLKNLKNELVKSGKSFLEVYINGHVLTNDTQAMDSIVRQICLENEVTMDGYKVKSFSENLEFLRSALKAGKFESMPIFFILDEFDLFASRSRRQTLLYNLSDLLQEYTAQLALVGLTTRFDAYELLEKRIRSRITYRVVVFPMISEANMHLALQNALSLPGEDDSSGVSEYNRAVAELLQQAEMKDIIKRNAFHASNLSWLYMLSTLVFSQLNELRPVPNVDDFKKAEQFLLASNPSQVLRNCSHVQLAMLVSMCKLERNESPSNFACAFDLYHKYCSRSSKELEQKFPRECCLVAFSELEQMGLIQSHDPTSSFGGVKIRYKDVSLNVSPFHVLDCIKKKADCPSWLQQWSRQEFKR